MIKPDIIAIGASTGGIEAIIEIVKKLPEDLPASVFIVQHQSPTSDGYLNQILSRVSKLKVEIIKDFDEIKKGYIYVAPPDYHLLVKKSNIRIVRGPKENRVRPAIDPMFRSAAANHRQRVIGVILTGALNDGTAGLLSIKECGGITIVQDPNDAICPSMPQSAVNTVNIDYCVPVGEIGDLIVQLVNKPVNKSIINVPDEILIEADIPEKAISDFESQDKIGTPYVCPSCGERLWKITSNKLRRFCCHIDHAYTSTNLLEEGIETIDFHLQFVLSTIEDRERLLLQMAEDARVIGQDNIADIYLKQSKESSKNSNIIKNLLMDRKY